ncbi:hypothetical protein AJ87_10410 [Rhizobium yanglingense]|nr:hypothetical protein AJ87_10410 [Rhizobium yanglingense]
MFDYIERFYNPKRRHSTLVYLSPNEFAKKVGVPEDPCLDGGPSPFSQCGMSLATRCRAKRRTYSN